MTSQVLSDQVSVTVFSRLLRAHSSLNRELSARLITEHGLTINDYEALLHLAHADEFGLKRVDLAERLMLTPSGVTRLLDGLQRDGWVRKGEC
jgi:DNA-binding MarR family transcriptional regulator